MSLPADWSSKFDRLRDAKPAEAFRFENPGDTIMGVVDSVGEFTNEFGTAPTVTVTLEDGTDRKVFGFHNGLKKRIEDAKLEQGDGIKIVYLGQDNTKFQGRDVKYHKYEMAVIRGMMPKQATAADVTPPADKPRAERFGAIEDPPF